MSNVAPLFSDGIASQAETTLSGTERRTGIRKCTLETGHICFNQRHSSVQCTVRDLSDRGARLHLLGSIDTPDTFELYIELDGSWVDCDVVWRSKSEIGVLFTSEKTPAPLTLKQGAPDSFHKPVLKREATAFS